MAAAEAAAFPVGAAVGVGVGGGALLIIAVIVACWCCYCAPRARNSRHSSKVMDDTMRADMSESVSAIDMDENALPKAGITVHVGSTRPDATAEPLARSSVTAGSVSVMAESFSTYMHGLGMSGTDLSLRGSVAEPSVSHSVSHSMSQSTAVLAAHGDWDMLAEDGVPYFFNRATGESTWNPPSNWPATNQS